MNPSVKAADQPVEVRRFFLASQVKNAFQKIADGAKPYVLELFNQQPVIYYTMDQLDAASCPEIITAGTHLKAIKSFKRTRKFLRPCDAAVKLTLKQLLQISVFDPKLVDAAVTTGLLTELDAKAIETVSDVSEFPLVQHVK